VLQLKAQQIRCFFSAPATDVHSAPSNEGVVATIDVSPTIQPGMKKNR